MKANDTKQTSTRPVIRKVSRGYQVTLPPEFREKNHLAIGDHVQIEQQGEVLLITVVKDRKQEHVDTLMEKLSRPLPSVPDLDDEEAAMRLAIREIKRFRKEQDKHSPRRA